MMSFFLIILFSFHALAEIKDNSFLLEEAYNQKPGEYQFINAFRSLEAGKEYEFISEGEMALGSEKHQFSYQVQRKKEDFGHGSFGDMTLNYRFQSINTPDILIAHRFGLIVPTGSVGNRSGYGVTGLRYLQSTSLILNEFWDNHWNLGFNHFPGAKFKFSDKSRSLNELLFGGSLIYHWKANLNFLVEALFEANEKLNLNGKKKFNKEFILNPGIRTAMDLSWKQTQIVPGLAFPVRYENDHLDHGVYVYLSIEPEF